MSVVSVVVVSILLRISRWLLERGVQVVPRAAEVGEVREVGLRKRVAEFLGNRKRVLNFFMPARIRDETRPLTYFKITCGVNVQNFLISDRKHFECLGMKYHLDMSVLGKVFLKNNQPMSAK